MRRKIRFSLLCCTPLAMASLAMAADTPYATAVKSLSPTYYYQLNEPDATAGVVDSMGNAAAKGTYNGDYAGGVPQAGCAGPQYLNEGQDGSGQYEYSEIAVPGVGGGANLAHCSNNEGHIVLGPNENYGANTMTVSMFFQANFAQGGDRLFTNNLADPNLSFQLNVANDGLVVAVDPNQAGEFAERTLTTIDGSGNWDRALIQAEYGWFHVVASTTGAADQRAGNIKVWVNGVDRTDTLVVTNWGWGINTNSAKIGGRHDDPKATTTHSGAQDEVAIWLGKALTDAEVQTLWRAATTGVVPSTPGDFDSDGDLDVADIDALAAASAAGTNVKKFDLNNDNLVNGGDIGVWTKDLRKVWVGDADVSGEFNSGDFVNIFTKGKYETGDAAAYSEGDWDGDGKFTSSDFVAAFTDGGYEVGPRAAVAAVPEPTSLGLVGAALAGLGLLRRRRA